MTEPSGRPTGLRLIDRARSQGDRPAFLSGEQSHSYEDLLSASERLARLLLSSAEGGPAGDDLEEERIAYSVPAGFQYAAVQWGIWRAGGIAVPLSLKAKGPELEHVLRDAGVSRVIMDGQEAGPLKAVCEALGIPWTALDGAPENGRGESPSAPPAEGGFSPALPTLAPHRRAMMLYTSGTTNKPKGVVSTHGNIEAQITSLVQAWGWQANDRIPLFLPLHHIHGIVNVMSCALWSGALVEAFPAFDTRRVLERVGAGAYTVFMAVPTIYVKLIQAFQEAPPEDRARWARGFSGMRLMISGSAALPAAIHEKWTGLTGQRLLERYGMTEIGMGLSNPLHGERRPGAVGQPLPGVELRLVSESGDVIAKEGEPGEIQVRGPGVFSEYWNLPEVTAASFRDGWFLTGDMAVLEKGYYRILGRLSVDIIKSGGYKLSALEIEDALRLHPEIQECAVVGVEDEVWGEAVAAVIKTGGDRQLTLDDLKIWAGNRLSHYKVPKHLAVVEEFPRNAMGKVMKPALKKLFLPA